MPGSCSEGARSTAMFWMPKKLVIKEQNLTRGHARILLRRRRSDIDVLNTENGVRGYQHITHCWGITFTVSPFQGVVVLVVEGEVVGFSAVSWKLTLVDVAVCC